MEMNSLTSKTLLELLTVKQQNEFFELLLKKKNICDLMKLFAKDGYYVIVTAQDIDCQVKYITTNRNDAVHYCINDIKKCIATDAPEEWFDDDDQNELETYNFWQDGWGDQQWWIGNFIEQDNPET